MASGCWGEKVGHMSSPFVASSGDCPLGELSISWAFQGPALELGTRLVASLGFTSLLSTPGFSDSGLPPSASLCLKSASPRPLCGCCFSPPRSQPIVTASREPFCPDSSTRPTPTTMPDPVTMFHCLSSTYHYLKLFTCN